MRLLYILFYLFMFSSLTGWSQSTSIDIADAGKPLRYLLKAKGPSGEVISTTGHIVKIIALSRPQSLEIARIYVNYNVDVKLKTDVNGETVALVSFHNMSLSGDLQYKGYDVENEIFPSLATFRLVLPGATKGPVNPNQVLTILKSANVNKGDCSVSISLHKKITQIPEINNLAFYHSKEDLEIANNQIKLIDSYFTAGWLMQRTENLLDRMQFTYLHSPSTFLASNMEVIVLMDWMTSQHFNRYAVFKTKDSLSLEKRLEVNRFKKTLIDQDFIKLNVIQYADLVKAANLFAENLAFYFDTSQPDLNRATYLSQMASSRLSTTGYKYILEFAENYAALHKHIKIDGRMYSEASVLIRHAMTLQASHLVEKKQYTEAMGVLNASENYDFLKENNRLRTDSLLIGKLSRRLYSFYIDIALKSLKEGIFTVTYDYYQKAYLLKQTYDGMIPSDSKERYLAYMISKDMLLQAEKSFKNNDVLNALAIFEQVLLLSENAKLKSSYEIAKSRLETISNRPSGYKLWKGEDKAVITPVEPDKNGKVTDTLDFLSRNEKVLPSKEKINHVRNKKDLTIQEKNDQSNIDSTTIKKNILNPKSSKLLLTRSKIKLLKDSAFLERVIKHIQTNIIKKAIKDSIALEKINSYNHTNQLYKDSTVYFQTIKKQFLANRAKQNIRDSLLLAANISSYKAILLKLSQKTVTILPVLVDKQVDKQIDSTLVTSSPKKKISPRNIKSKRLKIQSDSLKFADTKSETSIPDIKEQISANIKSIHLKIWSGDTLSSLAALNKTDSLQRLLSKSGDKSFELDMKALRVNYEEMYCEQQKMIYLHELVKIRNLIKTKDLGLASSQLKLLILKQFPAFCLVDKSEAIHLESTLQSPKAYEKWQSQLDSITRIEEPAAIIDAFEKANEYYRINKFDKMGIEAPDMMTALKSRNETAFLLKAVLELLNTHRPDFALELMKEIHKLEPKPDKTITMQKRLGEMLASGDYSASKTANEVINSYNINDKWYNELISAFKKQWRLISK